MIVRQADERDASKIFEIVNYSLDDYFSPEVVNFFLTQWPDGQFIAEDVFGNPVGAICGSLLEGGVAAISLFAVMPGHQDHGVGTRLLESFRRRCLMDGISTIQLEVREENVHAMMFYEKRGFRKTEFLPCFYSNGGNGYRMVCSANGQVIS